MGVWQGLSLGGEEKSSRRLHFTLCTDVIYCDTWYRLLKHTLIIAVHVCSTWSSDMNNGYLYQLHLVKLSSVTQLIFTSFYMLIVSSLLNPKNSDIVLRLNG
jgi:hypothetical protein